MKQFYKLAIALAVTLLPAAALAHAMLDHASPRVGSTVATAPKELTAVVHRKTGAGLLHRRGAQRARRGAKR